MLEYEREGRGWLGRLIAVITLNKAVRQEGFAEFILEDSQPKSRTVNFVDRRTGFVFETDITSRRVGVDTGLSTRLDVTQHIRNLIDDLSKEAPAAVRDKIALAVAADRWPE